MAIMPKITRRQTSSSRTKLADSRAQLVENLQRTNQIGDDAQRANVDLQNVLQKQQQMQQMLSNLSKIKAGTAMSVIRKIEG